MTRQTLLSYVELLDQEIKEDNRCMFEPLLALGMTLLDINIEDISVYSGASRATIMRWLNGKSVPYMRKQIYTWIKRRADEYLCA